MWRAAIRQRVHASWLVGYASTGLVVGVIGAQYVVPGWFSSMAWLLTSAVLLITSLFYRRVWCIACILCGGVVLGLWRGSVSQQALVPYQYLVGQTLTVSGRVADDVDTGKDEELVVRLVDVHVRNHALAGELWVAIPTVADIKRSDIVTVAGMLEEGFGSFSGSIYRAKLIQVRRPEPGDIARRVRDAFADKVRRVISEPQASLGIGYLVGQRRALPEELDTSLRIAGLTHVVVASGYNLTILVRLTRRLLAGRSRYLAVASASALIVAFIAVTGSSPSMTRAGLVSGLSLLAWYVGRRFHPLVLLPFVAAITLLISPSFGWNNLGWQLSFAAFGGVMIIAPLLQRYFFGDTSPGVLRQILGETLSAQLATVPLLVVAFGQFSNVALLANILVLPLVPLAMLLTFIAGVASTSVPLPIADIISFPAEILLRYMTQVASRVAHVPWAQTTLQVGWLAAALYYGAVVAGCVYMWRKTRFDFTKTSVVD